MALFRKGPSPFMTALAMIGAKPGDRALVAGRPDARLVAEVARSTGLNGQTLLAAPASLRRAYEAAAADAGVLVELLDLPADATDLPGADGTHDLAVLHFDLHDMGETTRQQLARSALSGVRPGGRVIVIEGRRRSGLLSKRAPTVPSDVVLALLAEAAGVAPRVIGTEDDVTYFETRRGRG